MAKNHSFKENRDLYNSYTSLFKNVDNCLNYSLNKVKEANKIFEQLNKKEYFKEYFLNQIKGAEFRKDTDAELELLKPLYQAVNSKEMIDSLNKIVSLERENIEKKLSSLAKSNNAVSWFFTNKKAKDEAEIAFDELSKLFDSDYIENIKNLIDSFSSLENLSGEVILNNFEGKKEEYKELLTNNNDKDFVGIPLSFLKDFKNSYDQLLDKGVKGENLLNLSRGAVKKSVDELLVNQLVESLRQIPVEELGRDKKGFRVKPFKDGGYNTIGDIYCSNYNALNSLYGVSPEQAYIASKTAKEYAVEARKGLKLKLSIDNKNKYSTKLIKDLFVYRKKHYAYKNIIDIENKECDLIESSLKNLASLGQGSLSLFYSDEFLKEKKDEFEYLSNVLENDFKNVIEGSSIVLSDEERPGEQEAWDDFGKHSISYLNDVEDICPGALGNGDTVYGLPEELAKEIDEECLFPDGLLCTLRKYQEWGVKYILHQGKVLLGDEMGLGKTVQAIASMVSLKNTGATHFVVICPASVLANWCREIVKHSRLKAYEIHGSQRKGNLEAWIKNGGVAVTTYETTDVFLDNDSLKIDELVVDEAHYIKNPDAKRTAKTKALCAIAKRIVFMSGTPIENNVDEMISLINVLNPTIASEISHIAFMSTAPQFREKVAPVYYRRKREDVLTELPDLIENKEWCVLTSEEKEIYEENILSKNYMAARRVSFDVDPIIESTKVKRLLEIIEDAKNDGRKVLVFSFFLDTIEKLRILLGNNTFEPITGSVAPKKRQQIIDEFDKAEPGKVLLAQIQSGGTGLNIQSASVVIICEPQFKPSIENQAISRAYRMGQARNVQVFRLLAQNSIDERITNLLDEKQAIFNAFADKSVAAEKSLEIDERTFGDIIREEIDRINKERGITPESVEEQREEISNKNLGYYEELMSLNYKDLVERLLKEHGPVTGDYFLNEDCATKNKDISKLNEGLFIHHIDEDKAINLSDTECAVKKPFEYQRKERLVYANFLEHYLLHVKITEENGITKDGEAVGIGGALRFIGRQLNDIYDGKIVTVQFLAKAATLIENDFKSYIRMVNMMWNAINKHPEYKDKIKKEDLALGWDANLIKKVFELIK